MCPHNAQDCPGPENYDIDLCLGCYTDAICGEPAAPLAISTAEIPHLERLPFGLDVAALSEPFCSCGRVISRCDGSRNAASIVAVGRWLHAQREGL